MRPIEIITLERNAIIVDAGHGYNVVNALKAGRYRHNSVWARISDPSVYALSLSPYSIPYAPITYGFEVDGSMLYGFELDEYKRSVFDSFLNGAIDVEHLMLPNEFHKLRNKS